MFYRFSRTALQLFIIGLIGGLLASLAACDSKSAGEQSNETVFLKADPEVNAELEFPPSSLRVFLSELPNVSESTMALMGPEGSVPLSGLHTMGADDLMIGIDQYPLAPGQYTVQWSTRFVEEGPEFSGSYNFTVKAKQE